MSEREINTLLIAATPSLGFYGAVIVLAIFAPEVAAFGYLVIAIVAVFRVHGDKAERPEIVEST